MKKYWEVFYRFRLMNLMVLFEYRGEFFFWGAISAMWTFFNYFFMDLLISSSGQIGGWSRNEIFLLMSIFTIYDALTWSFFYYNFRQYTNNIFTGKLDMFLVKPVDAQFMLTTQHNSFNNLSRLVIGIVMLFIATSQLTTSPTLGAYLLFFLLMIIGFVLMYSLWFTISTLAFWVEKLDNINDVIPSVRRISQWPKTVYTGVFSFIFTVVFPLALLTSVPAEALLGRLTYQWFFYFVVITIFFFFTSRAFFHFSLRKYSGAGS